MAIDVHKFTIASFSGKAIDVGHIKELIEADAANFPSPCNVDERPSGDPDDVVITFPSELTGAQVTALTTLLPGNYTSPVVADQTFSFEQRRLVIGDAELWSFGANASFGRNVGSDAMGTQSVAFGIDCMPDSTGVGCTAFGYRALFANESSALHTAFGANAGLSVYNQAGCSFFGYNAGKDVTSAYVTVFGARAALGIGAYSTVSGVDAASECTGSHNTISGYRAAYASDSSWYCTITGDAAGENMGKSDSHTLYGYQAGQNATGGNMTCIGRLSGQNAGNATGGVNLGPYAGRDVTDSYQLVIGNGPTNELIRGDFSTGRVDIDSTLYANDVQITSDERLKENIETLDGALAKVKQLRGVGFDWKTTPLVDEEIEEIEVERDKLVEEVVDGQLQVHTEKEVCREERVKTRRVGAREGQHHLGHRQLGFIAQEVEPLFPEAVRTDPKTGLKSVNYSAMVGPLLQAVVEQSRVIDGLTSRLEALEAR
jgi:hypothetical protein